VLHPSSSDARTAASVLAVDRALAWYIDEVPNAKSPPIDEATCKALRAALKGAQPWQPAQFEVLVTFGQAMHQLGRIDPSVPACNLGDALSALSTQHTAAPGTERWSFEPTALDAEAFAKLQFRETSLGISRAQRDNREGWWAHAQKNRAFILEAARAASKTDVAVALGAGQAFDLPLADLARTFNRLVLIDVDREALEATWKGVFGDPVLRAKVELRVLDLTGISAALVRRIDGVFAESKRAEEVQAGIDRLCRSYRLTDGPHLLGPGERVDFLASSCVLTQLALGQRQYAARLYEQRFTPIAGELDRRWSVPWRELELRVQQDHVNALLPAAEVVALTSDVVSRTTELDAGGEERVTGKKIFALGVDSLLERVPKGMQVDRHGAWEWGRYRASRKGGEGSRMDVEGAQLREPKTTTGLWLPHSPT
jgi:hypothetical protein